MIQAKGKARHDVADKHEHNGTLVAPPRAQPSGNRTVASEPNLASQIGAGSGWLGDADLATELARLTELQNRQRLDAIAPCETKRAPRQLLSLFRDR